MGYWVEDGLALFPHRQTLHVNLGQVALHGCVERDQLIQNLSGHPLTCQLAVTLGEGVFHVRGWHLDVAGLLGPACVVGCQVFVQAAKCNVALALVVAHDEAEHRVTNLAHVVALFARVVTPDCDLVIDRWIERIVTHFPSVCFPVCQVCNGHALEHAARLEAAAANTLHGLLATKQSLDCFHPSLNFVAQLLLIETRQVLAIPPASGPWRKHAQADQLCRLLGHDRLHGGRDLQHSLGRLGTALQLAFDHVADHLALLFRQVLHVLGHFDSQVLSLVDLHSHLAHRARQLRADRLEAD